MNALYKELLRRARLLAKEESGVALMLTLSVFLLLYVACAGVYAIGETVRQKIELQNACDAAAYSAAVVQADGLGRIATLNRALSWTYIQLTNLQMDYITSKWLELVAKRFQEDSDNCESHNDGSRFIHLFGPECDHNCEHNYSGAGRGWFCGSGLQHGYVKLNGKRTVPVSSLKSIHPSEEYREQIRFFKSLIDFWNSQFSVVNNDMQKSIYATASATLCANLPQAAIDEDGNTGIDVEIGKDMRWYINMKYPCNPYAQYYPSEEGEEVWGSYFSPLFNTEAHERIFLTMADGSCYDRLEPYFSNGNDDNLESGGLDQWFIRSYPEESALNQERVEVRVAKNKADDPLLDSYKRPGICRGYKNANREEGVDAAGGIARGHHKASLFGSLFSDDQLPSCINYANVFPEQCRSVDNTVALYADYEWAAIRVLTICWWTYSLFNPPKCHHSQIGRGVLNSCQHLCCRNSRHSRRRNPMKESDWYMGERGEGGSYTLSCYGDTTAYTELYVLHWTPHQLLPMIPPYGFGNYLRLFPNGFARIYGDEDEIYDKETYTGETAMPWILNDRFYSKDGSIIVGLARRHRNPFTTLIEALGNGADNKDEAVKGIYSAFNPVTNGYLVAFSAGRAAHRFHPSDQQWKVIQGGRHHPLADQRDYETRYDSVCHDDIMVEANEKAYNDGLVKFKFVSNDDLKKMHVGCVCEDAENHYRFARCWNLWQTDWDATLLPVAYARADAAGAWFDSYLHDKASSGNVNEQGNITWESSDEQVNVPLEELPDEYQDYGRYLNPFEESVYHGLWFRFFDEDGNLITDEDRDPDQDNGRLPRGTISGRELLPGIPGQMPGKGLDLQGLIRQRIL